MRLRDLKRRTVQAIGSTVRLEIRFGPDYHDMHLLACLHRMGPARANSFFNYALRQELKRTQ